MTSKPKSEEDTMMTQAIKVASEHAALQTAKREKQKAQVAYLRAAVNSVRPALIALCSRMPNTLGPAVRALNVGHCLYLGETGGWIESCEGGALLLARADEYVAEHFCAEDIVDTLSVALTKHAGSREWSTTEIRREAERLRAATLLLKS